MGLSTLTNPLAAPTTNRVAKRMTKVEVDAELVAHILSTHSDYDTLGLDHDATAEDVRAQYKQLAVGLHPDKCALPRAHEAFLKATKARYALLSTMA